MIQRFLVISQNRIFFSTSKTDFEESPKVKLVELLMPIDVFYDAEKHIKKLDFLHTQNSLQMEIKEGIKRLFFTLNRFAVQEKDRIWLFDQSQKK